MPQDSEDRRKYIRISNIDAQILLAHQFYKVKDLSAQGLAAICESGFDPHLIDQLKKGEFEFTLSDPSGSKIICNGKIIRLERKNNDIVAIGISFEPKKSEKNVKKASQIIAVGGAKGGVGKTIVSVNLALSLSRCNRSVVLFDGDFGNANCHTLLGLTTVQDTLEEYLLSDLSLSKFTMATAYPKLNLICGASNKIDTILNQKEKNQKLIRDLQQLTFDYIIIDLGAGIGDHTLDLYNIADHKLIVVTPQFTALQNAYSFVKSALYQEAQKKEKLQLFLAKFNEDILKMKSLLDSPDAEARFEYKNTIKTHDCFESREIMQHKE